MLLNNRTGWFYQNILKSKQDSIQSGINLANQIQKELLDHNLSKKDAALCALHLQSFKCFLISADDKDKNAVELIYALEPLNDIFNLEPGLAGNCQMAFRQCINNQISAETQRSKLIMDTTLVLGTFLLALIVTGMILGALFAIQPLLLVSLYAGIPAAVLTILVGFGILTACLQGPELNSPLNLDTIDRPALGKLVIQKGLNIFAPDLADEKIAADKVNEASAPEFYYPFPVPQLVPMGI